MTVQTPVEPRRVALWSGFYGVILLLTAEVFLTLPLLTWLVKFDCWQNWPEALCKPLFSVEISLFTLVPCLVFLAMLLSPERRALTRDAALRARPLAVNLLGVAVFLLPSLWLRDGTGTRFLLPSLLSWGIGLTLAAVGALLLLAPVALWRDLLRRRGALVALCLLAGLGAPFVARAAQPLWDIHILSDATFHCVVWLLQALGQEVTVDFPTRAIGNEAFIARIAPLCSGVEGIALITFFVTLYLVIFRRELRFPAALILYPLGLAASWLLNVVRIAGLIAIGTHGNAELAMKGFHSHAGWLMFTLLALALVLVARSSGLIAGTAAPRRPVLPFFADPAVARILPFALFMASALLASTFATMPALVYPLRALVMVLALWPFRAFLRGLEWRIDPLSLALGLAIGLVWALTSPGPGASDQALATALGQLSPLWLAAWVAARVLGTVILVPIIEELFFRDHLLPRLGLSPVWRAALAVVVTSTLFGALHDRWALAFVAGATYALLRLRRGRVGDAIQAHMASNAVIAVLALALNDWSLI